MQETSRKTKPTKTALLLDNETRSRFLSIQAQTGLDGNEVFESAINLVYQLLPNDRDARVNMNQVVADTLAKVYVPDETINE